MTLDVIAERKLECRKAKGGRVPVVLRLGRPYRVGDGDWACAVEATGLQQRFPDVHGVDSWQSLVLAQDLLRSLIQGVLERGDVFYWPDSGDEMPLEAIFGRGTLREP